MVATLPLMAQNLMASKAVQRPTKRQHKLRQLMKAILTPMSFQMPNKANWRALKLMQRQTKQPLK
jgi:hypothetical protein